MDTSKVVSITADVMNSRQNGKEKQLEKITTHLNGKFEDHLVTTFSIRSGDELFGILKDFKAGYQAFKELYTLSKVYNLPLYVGVGLGEIKNENLDNPNTVNGLAIWNSADALSLLKQNHSKTRAIQSLDKSFKFMFVIGENNPNTMIVNYLVYFILEKIKKRTEKQAKAIAIMEENPDWNYEEVGARLGYETENAISNVSKLLNRAEHNIVKEAEQELIHLMNLIFHREGIK